MRPRGIIVVSFLLAAACSAANPPAAGESQPSSSPSTTSSSGTVGRDAGATADDDDDTAANDAGTNDAADAFDAFDGFVPPPASECNPDLTIGTPALTTAGARFAGITRDERTIAWTAPGEEGKTTLFVADRDSTDEAFGAPFPLNLDAATDGVAIADDGLALYAVASDHRSFIVYERPDRDTDFAAGDDSIFDNILADLGPEEKLGDPVFVNSGVVFLYSQYGKSADTVRFANRISIYASFFPTGPLAFDELRASGESRRRPTGTGGDFQTLFYWDEVSKTEKLARLYGTESVMTVKDLGAHPWAQVNGSCSRVYFGSADVLSAAAQ